MSVEESIKSIDLEVRENKNIRDWGVKHKEECLGEETNRTEFRRQRDRILYTGGFRRLQDKTQVIAATKSGDHRTRLTHSLEVEQIAVSIADALGLNRDLVSAISLGHDVGHTPFGHAVEDFLNEELKDEGGFSHAVQSIRYLKKHINLSIEVFEGILKHDTDVYAGGYDKRQFNCDELLPFKPGSLEAQVVYWADKLAYITHDFEDFFRTEIYKNAIKHNKVLKSNLQGILCNIITDEGKRVDIKKDINNFETRDLIRNLLTNIIDQSLRNLINLKNSKPIVNPVIIKNETEKRIKDNERIMGLNNGSSENETKKIKKETYQRGLLINFREDYYEYYTTLREILNEFYIGSPEVVRSDAKAKKIAKSLFDDFTNTPKLLPLNIQKEINDMKDSPRRLIADYIASMTDRYAEEIFFNLNSIGSYYEY